jgi:drug/metabolite transporter (DMT)-like permease
MSVGSDADDAVRPTRQPAAIPTVPLMAKPHCPGEPAGRPPREPVSWPVVMGLGGLVLLFPLAELSGVVDALGRAPTVLFLSGLVVGVWIVAVGFGRVPRPVLTVSLAGAVAGVILVVLSVALGMRPHVDAPVAVLGGVVEIARATALGALAGLLAAAVQRGRNPPS